MQNLMNASIRESITRYQFGDGVTVAVLGANALVADLHLHDTNLFVRNAIHDKEIEAETVLFDSWYASWENLKLVHRSGRTFFTTLKSNRLVSVSKQEGYNWTLPILDQEGP